jgi:hypothetical protein
VTGTVVGAPSEDPGSAAELLGAVAAGLRAAGLTVRVHETDGTMDVTATLRPPWRREIEIIADAEGYVQVSWWSPPGATPGQVTASIGRVVAAISSEPDATPG